MRRRSMVTLAAVAALTTISLVAGPAPAATNHPGVQVKLLDAGAAPRALLRLQPTAVPQALVLTFSTEEIQSGISSLHVGPFTVQTVVSFGPSSTGATGIIRVPYTYGPFRVLDTSTGTPEELAALRNALATFQGFGGRLELSPTGAVIANTFSIPPAVNAQVQNLLQQVSGQSSQLGVPYPSQPVGVGARWRGTTHVSVAGISLTQTYEYTLRSRDGTRLSIDTRYVQTAASQRAHLPNTPRGVTVSVTGYRIVGSGSTVADLTRVAAVAGHVDASGVQRFRVRQGSQSGTINQQVKLSADLAAG